MIVLVYRYLEADHGSRNYLWFCHCRRFYLSAMFRTFVENGLLTPEEAANVMNQAGNAVRDSVIAGEAPPFIFYRAFSGSFIPDTPP